MRAAYRGRGLRTWLELRLGGDARSHARVLRAMRRHFPRKAEAVEGLARGARVSERWLIAELMSELARPATAARAMVIEKSEEGRGPLLVRSAPEDLMLRHSRPESGLCSVELSRPSLAVPLGGVNEAGLAALVIAGGGEESWGAAAIIGDCLARFECVGAALEWCRARPFVGGAELLFGDVRGEVAAICCDRDGGSLRRPVDGRLSSGPAGEHTGSESLVLLDPVGRRLGVKTPNSTTIWHAISCSQQLLEN